MSNQVVAITGASAGIGPAAALASADGYAEGSGLELRMTEHVGGLVLEFGMLAAGAGIGLPPCPARRGA